MVYSDMQTTKSEQHVELRGQKITLMLQLYCMSKNNVFVPETIE